MNKLYKLIAVVAAFFLTACGGGSSDSGNAQQDQPTPVTQSVSVVAIGDSIGTGFGIATPWPVLLGRMLGVPVNNNSISGEQTSYGARIIGDRLDAVQPSHVLILLGTNDAIRGSVDNAIANLQTMVNAAQQRNVIALVGTLPPITRSVAEDARAQQINAGIRGLSGATIVGVRAALGDGSGTIADGIHPNQMGQQIISDAFAGAF
jgi:lysophospholipase L1-like esterase